MASNLTGHAPSLIASRPGHEPHGLRPRDATLFHYRVEKQMADRLRQAPARERRRLYKALSKRIYAIVPDHPYMAEKLNPAMRAAETERQVAIMKRFIGPDARCLAIGMDADAVARIVAGGIGSIHVANVSDDVVVVADAPAGIRDLGTDGISIPLPAGSIDIAVSIDTMERLHPDDARTQIAEIVAALKPGCCYVCLTPNRLFGPHDISEKIDEEAAGLNLKEYSNGELAALFRAAGFRKCRALLNYEKTVFPVLIPLWPVLLYERIVAMLPKSARHYWASWLMGVKFVGIK